MTINEAEAQAVKALTGRELRRPLPRNLILQRRSGWPRGSDRPLTGCWPALGGQAEGIITAVQPMLLRHLHAQTGLDQRADRAAGQLLQGLAVRSAPGP